MRITEVIEPLTEGPVQRISKQQAMDRGMFGPVYHGSSEENRAAIAQHGFKVHGVDDDIAASNGFLGKFDAGYPGIPPVHLLGYGVYFTPSPSVAKQYNRNSMRGVIEYYLDVPRLEEIGFTSTNTIWRWWVQHGYDFSPELYARRKETYNNYAINHALMREQIRATKKMTEVLASQYDAVYLRRNAFRRGVDDTQICVYDPRRIYQIDKTLSVGLDVGARVVATGAFPERYRNSNDYYMDDLRPDDFGSYGKLGASGKGWKGIFRASDEDEPLNPDSYYAQNNMKRPRAPIHVIPPAGMVGTITTFGGGAGQPVYSNPQNIYHVKWTRGGVMYNYAPEELQAAAPKQQ